MGSSGDINDHDRPASARARFLEEQAALSLGVSVTSKKLTDRVDDGRYDDEVEASI